MCWLSLMVRSPPARRSPSWIQSTVDLYMAPRKWGFDLKSNSTNYPDHCHHGNPPPPTKKIPMVEPGIEPGTSWFVARSHPDRLQELALLPPPHSENGLPTIRFSSFLSSLQLVGFHHTRHAAQVNGEASTHRLSKWMRQTRSPLSVRAECCTGPCPVAEGCLVIVMTWYRVEENANLRPNTIRAPAGVKLVTTDGFGTLGMDEISDRRWPTDSIRSLEQGLGETRPAARYFRGGATLRARNLA